MNHLLLVNQLNLSEGPEQMLADENAPCKNPPKVDHSPFVAEKARCLKITIAWPVSGRGSKGSTSGLRSGALPITFILPYESTEELSKTVYSYTPLTKFYQCQFICNIAFTFVAYWHQFYTLEWCDNDKVHILPKDITVWNQ